jgi:hypothetical protein
VQAETKGDRLKPGAVTLMVWQSDTVTPVVAR